MLLRGKRIFIVEDDSLNRIVYNITLGLAGAILVFDNRGRESIKKLQKRNEWDLIILDLMLSRDTSGYSVFEEIRSIESFDIVPIVAISASDPDIAIPAVQNVGFSAFISKPIDEAQIVNQILRIIDGENIWHDGR